jgi:rhodanese-related sulfurtransferase
MRQFESRKVFLESVIVAVAGLVFALVANQVSPRGLALARDYFPGAPRSRAALRADAPQHQGTVQTGDTKAASVRESLAARLRSNGLQLAESNQVMALFHDPRYEQELVVFIDSRADREYQAGHVPGAYPFDRYHLDNFLPAVLPVCQTAEQIVIYCNGGDCDDSEFAAIALRDAGLPGTNLLVYAGGLAEWTANALPIERGARKSGDLLPRTP